MHCFFYKKKNDLWDILHIHSTISICICFKIFTGHTIHSLTVGWDCMSYKNFSWFLIQLDEGCWVCSTCYSIKLQLIFIEIVSILMWRIRDYMATMKLNNSYCCSYWLWFNCRILILYRHHKVIYKLALFVLEYCKTIRHISKLHCTNLLAVCTFLHTDKIQQLLYFSCTMVMLCS